MSFNHNKIKVKEKDFKNKLDRKQSNKKERQEDPFDWITPEIAERLTKKVR